MSTSLTANSFPPPFVPLNPTKHPGKNPIPPAPGGPPRTFISGSNLSKTRWPDPSIRDDSSQVEVSVIFAASVSGHNRPTTRISSCVNATRSVSSTAFCASQKRTNLRLHGRVAKLFDLVVLLEDFGRLVNERVEHCAPTEPTSQRATRD